MPNYNRPSNDYMRRDLYSRPTGRYSTGMDARACASCTNDPLRGMPLAMAYVPWQEWQNLYSAEKGFCRGTIFEDFDKPFLGTGGCQK